MNEDLILRALDGGFLVKARQNPRDYSEIVFAATNVDQALAYIRDKLVAASANALLSPAQNPAAPDAAPVSPESDYSLRVFALGSGD